MRFIGIDLAWIYKNETCICILNDEGRIEYLKSLVISDDEIVQLIKSCAHDNVCVAIDAPLVVKNYEGSRVAERMFKEIEEVKHSGIVNKSR